ncbi:DUF2165 domain-containing protein [Kaustia mangrovi]|uniref:DUF2165 domain-containing protein n=1 Tax=Kaustia mangrovi TaxID=2593653 RepID=A0A7S8C1N5_9HYPH|nr:DUF2165 domain-containing protein [Kaustia mangrovi]QPC41724.1 DUF2165 domain-containing protein [Kaustia mangrovi]
MTIRLSKALLVLLIGLFALLVGANNIVDYESNFAFVQHVLSMDTTFPDNALMWRAITDETVHHAAYWLIIIGELVTGGLCVLGALALLAASRSDADRFNAAKRLAVCGLTLGFALWFFGFMTVGAEWFLMWQSQTWNGQQAAFRFIVCIGLVLVYLNARDGELRRSPAG